MLPGVSAEDCLVADLGVDPGEHGWQSWEATGFLLRGFRPDPTAGLVLWQVDGIGKLDWNLDPDPRGAPGAGGGARRALSARARAGLLPRVDLPDRRRTRRCVCRSTSSPTTRAPPAPTLYVPPLPGRAGRPRRWPRATRRHAVVAVEPSAARARSTATAFPFASYSAIARLDALARLVGAARRAQHDGELEQDVAAEVEQVGRLDDRERVPRDALRLVERAGVDEEPCAGEAVEHLRPEVLLGRGRLDLADELFRLRQRDRGRAACGRASRRPRRAGRFRRGCRAPRSRPGARTQLQRRHPRAARRPRGRTPPWRRRRAARRAPRRRRPPPRRAHAPPRTGLGARRGSRSSGGSTPP